MMDFSLQFADVFHHQQRLIQHIPCTFINLSISGLNYSRAFDADSNFIYEATYTDNVSGISVVLPGWKVEFSFSAKRENWVIGANIPFLSYRPGEAGLRWSYKGTDILFPFYIELLPEQATLLREKFQEVTQVFHDNVPKSRLRAEIATIAVLDEFLKHPVAFRTSEVAQLFKNAIDADTLFRKTLSEIAKDIGMSLVYLRKQFFRNYLIDPNDYRNRRRLQIVLTLFAQTACAPKEIADRVGMKHVTHLYAFLRKHCHATPKEILHRYRL